MVDLIANKVAIKIHFCFSSPHNSFSLVRLQKPLGLRLLFFTLEFHPTRLALCWLYLIIFGTQLIRYNFIIIAYSLIYFDFSSWL